MVGVVTEGMTEERRIEAMLQQLRGYWEGLRENGALPRRARIDPRGIEGVLARAFLIERIAEGTARFRLAGSYFGDLMGMDVRGMPVSALFDPTARQRLADVLEPVFAVPGIAELQLEADRGLGRPALSGRMLILPVVGEREAPLAFGCFATIGLVGRGPRRFSLARAVVETVHLPGARGGAAAEVPALQSGWPEPRRVPKSEPPPRAAPGRRHLRLVSSD